MGKVVAIFTMPIFTSILTKEEYGIMALITSCQGILDIFSNLNIHSGIARDYYEVEGKERRKLVSTGFYSILSFSFIFCVILIFSQRLWRESLIGVTNDYETAFTLMLLSVPSGSLLSYFAILTRYKKKPVLFTIGSVFQLIIQISISVLGVVKMGWGVNSMFLGILVSQVFTFLFFFVINKDLMSFSFNLSILKKALIFSIPTIPAILAGWVDGSLGQIMIGKSVSIEDLGIYSIALHLASILSFMSIALNNVWGPFLYENYKTDSFIKNVIKLYSIVVVLLIVLSGFVSLFSKEIILIFTNENYLDARFYLTLLMLPMSLYMLFPIVSAGIFISRNTKYISVAYIAGALLNLLFLFLFIERMGVVCVPISLTISRIATFLLLYKVSLKKMVYKLPIYLNWLQFLLIAFCFLVLMLDWSLLYRIILFMCLAFVTIIIGISKGGVSTFLRTILANKEKV